MSSYWLRVYLDRVTCHNTESLHSSDKFALSGVVLTDQRVQGFVMPVVKMNGNGQPHRYPEDLNTIFEGPSSDTKVGIGLLGWDLDDNDSWVDNKEDIIAVSKKISEGVEKLPVVGQVLGIVLDAAIAVVPPVIDQFVDWDQDDKLLDDRKVYEGYAGNAYQEVSRSVSVRFNRDDWSGYSDWDYTLDFTIYCTWMPSIFGEGKKPLQPTEQPYQNSIRDVWLGVWDGQDIVVDIQRNQIGGFVDVTVTETLEGKSVTTRTEGATFSRLYMEFEPNATLKSEDVGSSVFEQGNLTTELVRYSPSSPRAFTREVLLGSARRGVSAGSAVQTRTSQTPMREQFRGDHLMLNNDTSLEIHHLLHQGHVIGQALRYRRPTSPFLTVESAGLDRMLHRRTFA